MDGLVSYAGLVLVFAGKRAAGTGHVLAEVAETQVPLPDLGAGQVAGVTVVHFVDANCRKGAVETLLQ